MINKNNLRINIELDNLGELGLSQEDSSHLFSLAKKAFDFVSISRYENYFGTGWFNLPYVSDLSDIIQTAQYVRKHFKYFVILGIGGSALGARMIFNSLCSSYYNEQKNIPKFYIIDTIDPEYFSDFLSRIDINKTCFNIISKSGQTVEIISQLDIILSKLKKKSVVLTTSHLDSKISSMLPTNSILKQFIIPENVGGRFSVLSSVGLFPAAVLGLPIEKLLQGAKYADNFCNSPNLSSNMSLLNALIKKTSMDKGYNINVIFPYSNKLSTFVDWYAQLYAESIGKNNFGQTPAKAIGPIDQHSQLQLYLDGPCDKLITIIDINKYNKDFNLSNCKSNKSLADIMQIEKLATLKALIDKNKLVYRICIPEISAFVLGQLIFICELEIAYLAAMLGINAYDQPAVQLIKNNIEKFLV